MFQVFTNSKFILWLMINFKRICVWRLSYPLPLSLSLSSPISKCLMGKERFFGPGIFVDLVWSWYLTKHITETYRQRQTEMDGWTGRQMDRQHSINRKLDRVKRREIIFQQRSNEWKQRLHPAWITLWRGETYVWYDNLDLLWQHF